MNENIASDFTAPPGIQLVRFCCVQPEHVDMLSGALTNTGLNHAERIGKMTKDGLGTDDVIRAYFASDENIPLFATGTITATKSVLPQGEPVCNPISPALIKKMLKDESGGEAAICARAMLRQMPIAACILFIGDEPSCRSLAKALAKLIDALDIEDDFSSTLKQWSMIDVDVRAGIVYFTSWFD